MINIPIEIDPLLKRAIKESYTHAMKNVGDEEALYIHKKLPCTLKILNKNPDCWLANVARVAQLLLDLYVESLLHPNVLSEELQHSILAALFYLCNPYDIIPDYTPGIGYVDDACVFNFCLQLIKKSRPRLYDNFF